jgi:hypothetical protein
MDKGNFDGSLDLDDFDGIEDGMINASLDSNGIDEGNFEG